MEGWIPKIYKSLKRSKSLRQRKNPQPSPIQNIEDFYPDGYNFIYDDIPPAAAAGQHAKTKLMHQYDAGGRYYWPQESIKSPKKFGSQRRMFSCITGGAGAA